MKLSHSQKPNFPGIRQAALIPVTGVFAYAILDVLFVLDGFRSSHFSNEEKKAYASVISIFSLLFIYSAFSEYKHNYAKFKLAEKKNLRLDKRIELYKQELMRENNNMRWEYLPFNIKKDISNLETPNQLLEDKVSRIFPKKNQIDIDSYFYLSWERHVAKKKAANKIFHYQNKIPLLHADYALLTMFSIDFNLSIWCLNAFNKPKLEWIHDKDIINEKSKFRKNKFRKIQHLLDQYRISNPNESLVFVESPPYGSSAININNEQNLNANLESDKNESELKEILLHN